MQLQKINWKINFKPGNLETEDLFRFFNSLIEDSPQVFVDIADYKHVPGGPVVLLVGVNADVGYDGQGNSLGIHYNQKKILEGTNQENLRQTLEAVISIFIKMKDYKGFSEPPVLDLSKFIFFLNDRALASNNSKSFIAVKPELQQFFQEIFATENFTLNQVGAEKDRLTVEVLPESVPDLAQLESRLVVSQ